MTSKRAFDLVVGSIALVVAAPLLLAVALAMRLSGDRGPFFYRAIRIGEGSRPITVLKVRTMIQESGGPRVTLADDPRVTRLGQLIRRLRIDELPQLLGVLRGDLSLVGPRPEDPAYVDLSDPLHQRVFTARPGITGLAQLSSTMRRPGWWVPMRIDIIGRRSCRRSCGWTLSTSIGER